MRAEALVVLAASLTAIACGEPMPPPPPRVLSTSPSGAVAPEAVSVEIAFSEPLDARGVEDGRFFALCRREDLRDVMRAAESEAGIAAGVPVVAARAALADAGRRAVLTPAAPLEPERSWAAVLSYRARGADGRPIVDSDGKARTIAVLFETGPAVDRDPPRSRWVVPPQGPVPGNVASLRIAFAEPVTGDIALPLVAGARATVLAPDLLGVDLAAPLAAGPLVVDLSRVRDAAGNVAAGPEPLVVSACRAELPPAISDVRATAEVLSVSLRTSLRGLGRLVADVTTRPGDGSCGSVPAAPQSVTFDGDFERCPRWDPCAPAATDCTASVQLRGLCPGQPVRVRLASLDLAGHRAAGPALEVAALDPQPQPVITEVLADADAPESGGEYVEIANLGTGDLDLTGFTLAKRTSTGNVVRCAIAASGPSKVAPGAHALVVGGAYDGRYPLPAGTPLYRCGATALAGGLPNDRPVAVALEQPGGNVASAAGMAEALERCAAGALERIHPAGPDVAANFACPGSRSPGECNRSTPPSECPRRPW